ncbi:hypothetical protein EPUS_08254 [Endocarpon pusillum Z07020]|uniref:Uncharacterized protein n=1 Tax=Endocarpon pusillum (strain Z07020 / HMAS-L-300199) TaxID=1263415 RepID=U1HYN9_ENDPU|nr:uncharacterized protein EPUS_08254 [Endocarpon pusillum Z07020]ERF76000.1 hypothetical protein EPUS_08254 [Endocarpon pusillum Z07020]
MLVALWLISSLPSVQAEHEHAPNKDCPLPSDTDREYRFDLPAWVTRGGCIRERGHRECSRILEAILDSLAKIREAEYASAASVLSLLPTIGALFGPPTSEIWRLKSIVPFGGALAMSLSFGGALMPVNVEDYENAVAKGNTAIGSIISLRRHPPGSQKDVPNIDERLQELSNKIRERIDRLESVRPPKKTLILGLVVMFILFSMAQAAMAVVEQGGVINFLCSARYWMHMWYFLVTLAAFAEDRAHRPFNKTYKLYLSSLSYDVEILGGQPISDYFSTSTATENALKQLKTLRPASMNFFGSSLQTPARNSVIVMVSIVGQQKWEQIGKRLSRVFSVAVFVMGTAVFASATLLSLIMAVVVLTLTLAAGIFGRAIASWIVSNVAGTEPMIHIISGTKEEAYQAIAEILSLKSNDGSPFQVEINGQIFINERRVASRSWLKVALFGVLAEPYDIAKPYQKTKMSSGAGMSLNPLSSGLTNTLRGGVSIPFLSSAADPSLPIHRTDNDAVKTVSQQSVPSIPPDNQPDN